jgi:hypothetical protein
MTWEHTKTFLKIESKPSRSLVPFTSITSTRGLGDRARYDGTLLFQREAGIRERLSAGKTATRRHVNINQQITTALQNLFRDRIPRVAVLRVCQHSNHHCLWPKRASASWKTGSTHAAHAKSKALTSSTQQHHPWICTCVCTGSRGRPRCDVTPEQRLHLACNLASFCRMMLGY